MERLQGMQMPARRPKKIVTYEKEIITPYEEHKGWLQNIASEKRSVIR